MWCLTALTWIKRAERRDRSRVAEDQLFCLIGCPQKRTASWLHWMATRQLIGQCPMHRMRWLLSAFCEKGQFLFRKVDLNSMGVQSSSTELHDAVAPPQWAFFDIPIWMYARTLMTGSGHALTDLSVIHGNVKTGVLASNDHILPAIKPTTTISHTIAKVSLLRIWLCAQKPEHKSSRVTKSFCPGARCAILYKLCYRRGRLRCVEQQQISFFCKL